MKSKLISILLVLCMVLSALIGLTSCNKDNNNTTPETAEPPQKLSSPAVTLKDGVASWKSDSNADKFEISLDGSLSYVENTVTTKNLTNGQTSTDKAHYTYRNNFKYRSCKLDGGSKCKQLCLQNQRRCGNFDNDNLRTAYRRSKYCCKSGWRWNELHRRRL